MTMLLSYWHVCLLVFLAVVALSRAQDDESVNIVQRGIGKQEHKISITTTVRRLLRVIAEGLKDLYARVGLLRRNVKKEAEKNNLLRKKVVNMDKDFNFTKEQVLKNKLETDKNILDTEKVLSSRINDSHNTLLRLLMTKSSELEASLSRVDKMAKAEKLSLSQLHAEFAEGEFKINNTIHDIDIPQEGSVTIVGGGSRGLVRVRYIGDWTYICGDIWTQQDAIVVCKSHGYSRATPRAYTVSSGVQVKLDGFVCSGREDALTNCPHTGHAFHGCLSKEIAAVDCNPTVSPGGPGPQHPSKTTITVGSTRLVGGGDGSIGRLEVKHAGVWGTVCDDQWTYNNAAVVCRSLNLPFKGALAFVGHKYPHSHTVLSGTPIWLDDVICDGNEVNLIDCSHGSFGAHDCDEYENVGVQCA